MSVLIALYLGLGGKEIRGKIRTEEITLALSADDMVICVKTPRNRHESSNRWVQQGHRIEDPRTKSVFLYTISEPRVTGIKIQHLSQLPKKNLDVNLTRHVRLAC